MSEDERSAKFVELTSAMMTLMIHMGLFNTVIKQFPEHVQHNFFERMGEQIEWAERETVAIQSFGEAYDE